MTITHLFRHVAATVAVCTSGLAFAGPVNVNTADAKTLAKELAGVGKTKAELIVAHREANGPFTAPGQLMQIKGIGKKVIERNGDDILVD